MPALLEPTEKPAQTEPPKTSEKAKPDPQDAQEISKLWLDIPGRSVNPAKLTAFLRSNFGIGAYDIMVWETHLHDMNLTMSLDGSQHVYHWNTEEAFGGRDRQLQIMKLSYRHWISRTGLC
jgi:hypothetical protein